MNLRSCEDRRRPHPHGGQGVANGSNFKRRSQKGGNFLVGGTWGRRRRRMRAQKGGARIYLFDYYLFCKKVKVFWLMDSQYFILFCSVLEEACLAKDLNNVKTCILFRNISWKRTTTIMKHFTFDEKVPRIPAYLLDLADCLLWQVDLDKPAHLPISISLVNVQGVFLTGPTQKVLSVWGWQNPWQRSESGAIQQQDVKF